ncbi:MAG TPA: carboxypeptidase regulatory-like domain-containing protein [Gemmatimonadota bacterium]|nr:carboxypeptidase regulatory-like domain-containing protein [Gemmatimonadota bacterium]
MARARRRSGLILRNVIPVFALMLILPAALAAQGVTTGALSGTVVASTGESVVGASVIATHEPSGSQYGTVVREGGGYDIRGVRVGGPYTIAVQMLGYETSQETEIFVNLNQTIDTDFTIVPEAVEVAGIQVLLEADPVLNSSRTGAATFVTPDQVTELPSLRRSVRDLSRLDPRSDGNFSFGGRNWLYNNISLDGSYFGNPFGLDDPAPGGQTSAEPVPYDAIEAVQVSVAPYDVRQSGFTGAAVNSVTKSGTNEWRGSAYTFTRNEAFIGDQIGDVDVLVPDLSFNQSGVSLGGPIVRDKAFFFVNYERERREDPGSNFSALRPGETPGGTTSRVSAEDLEAIRQRMIDVYDYDPGAFENYIHNTDSDKFIAKFDWNVNDRNKFTFRYNLLDAVRALPPHPFAISINNTGRGPNESSLPFQNAGYAINNELNSFAGELNTQADRWANRFFVSYNRFRDFREPNSAPFPTIEIAEDGVTYTTLGHEPFSIHNLLDQDVFQITNDFSLYRGNHVYTLGTNYETFSFGNSFNLFYYNLFFLDQYPSLEDFFDATDPTSPNFRDFNADVANATAPFADDPSEPGQFALYAQDDWRFSETVNFTFGLRADIPFYATDLPATPFADALELLDEDGNPEQITWNEFPDSKVLWSPRVGFNWDLKGDRTMQVRGGTGIFTGRLPFVWIGNQAANQGPDANDFDLNATVDDFSWPQVWKSNIALDQLLPTNTLMTIEFMYGDNINEIFIRNPNLVAPVGTIPGPDGRPFYGGAGNNRLNAIPTGGDTYVLDNNGQGYDVSFTAQLRQVFRNGLSASAAYNFTEAKNNMDSTEIAFALWQFNPVEGNPNNYDAAYSQFGHRHRITGSANYRHSWTDMFATSFGLFLEVAEGGFFTAGRTSRYSYTVAGDLNGDGNSGNDLIYVPRDQNEINLVDIPGGLTAAQQWTALNAFIEQDDYLSENRGEITERNGAINPWFSNLDLRVLQDVIVSDHTFQVSLDVLNFANLLNSDWGVREVVNNAAKTPLILCNENIAGCPGTFNAEGEPLYQFPGTVSETFIDDPAELSRWRAQLGFRYLFH